jgi:hypothetical protein
VHRHILRDLSEYATQWHSRIHRVLQCSTSTRAKRETFYCSSSTGIDVTAAQADDLHRAGEDVYSQAGRAVPTIKEKDGVALSAYAVPVRPKYERPPSSKFGKDLLLWKIATSCFLSIVKKIGPQIDVLGSSMIYFDNYRCL